MEISDSMYESYDSYCDRINKEPQIQEQDYDEYVEFMEYHNDLELSDTIELESESE